MSRPKLARSAMIAIFVATFGMSRAVAGEHPDYFGIQVLDEQTGRGVPLVELITVNQLHFITDSGGWIAVREPDWNGKPIHFTVKSHGYECPADGFGFRGVVLTPQPGGEATIRVQRRNIAQRLYRITGEGIYRDSQLLGKPVPASDSFGAGLVVGQDSAMAAIYHDRIHWFWGDTNRMRYPLGQYWMSGATSPLPGPDRFDPRQHILLEYFVDAEGFSRPMARLGVKEGPIWIDSVCVVPDADGTERLVCHYAHVKDVGKILDHGLAIYDDQSRQFERLQELPMDQMWRFPGQAHPIRHREGSVEYLYLGDVFPTVRVPATLRDLQSADAFEAWTCLLPGSDMTHPQFSRDDEGHLEFRWAKNAAPVDMTGLARWVKEGVLTAEETGFMPQSAETGKPLNLHRGSVAWNAHRQKWIAIACEQGGTSFLGEIWYAESKELTGPWQRAVKIATHDQYSFYNPVQHAFFDQEEGRVIFFEGTYTATFSGNPAPTPRYDYNQILYQLDLDDPRLQPAFD